MFLEEKEEKNRTINIIPLIDIIFLMLIFFMLATNFYKDKEIDFIVPKNKVELTNTSEEFLEIRLNEDKYLCNNEEMNFGELSEKFLKIWREKDYEGVVIFNNEKSEVRNLIRLLDILNKNKVSKFFFGEKNVYKKR
tara:strand:+ start:53742 stop:54152 length:411 start_codon:yes stop_codon:yes gene_type:complete